MSQHAELTVSRLHLLKQEKRKVVSTQVAGQSCIPDMSGLSSRIDGICNIASSCVHKEWSTLQLREKKPVPRMPAQRQLAVRAVRACVPPEVLSMHPTDRW